MIRPASMMVSLLRLPRSEKRLFARSLPLLVCTRVTLSTRPLPRVRATLEAVARRLLSPALLASLPPERIGWVVRAASCLVPFTRSCLPRALAMEALLKAAGLSPDLHLGVAPAPKGKLAAHAWVVCQGKVVMGDGDLDAYAPLLLPK